MRGLTVLVVLLTAPLVVADALAAADDVLAVGAGAGAGAAAALAVTGAALTAGALAAGAGVPVDAGGAAGVAGVPKPDGVQAQARPTPVTATPSTDRMARLNIRARLYTGDPPRLMTTR